MADIIISEYFASTTEKQQELIYVLLSPLGLQAKKNILAYVFGKNPDNKKDDIHRIVNDFEKIITERNLFAHWPVLLSDEALEDYDIKNTISFVKGKPVKDKDSGEYEFGYRRTFNEQQTLNLIQLIERVNNVFRKIVLP